MKQKTEFDMVPDQASISSVSREIRFFPTHNDHPASLSRDQIAAWNSDGYLGPLDAFSAEPIAGLRHYFDGLLTEAMAAGRDSYSISSAHLKHPRVWDLLRDDRIVRYVTDLLGTDVIGWGSHFFCKLPGDGKRVDWHQDCSYWPLTPTKSVTVWLAIDEADLDNGGMEIFTGSHTHGLVDFETSGRNSGNVLDQSIKHPERYGTRKHTPLAAGQISIHSDLLIHGSAPNESDRRRCGLTLRYCPADVTAYLGWNAKGVCVAGAAHTDAWPGAERPA